MEVCWEGLLNLFVDRLCLEGEREGEVGFLTPGSLMPQSPHFGAVPRFLMCSSRSLPPGVLITRVLLERVLYL
jgi:hypothetical protein